MRILNLPLLEAFKQDHADVRGQLEAWRDEVEREAWQTPQDIKRRYKSADFLAGNRVIFNIKGHYCPEISSNKFNWLNICGPS
ncbi:MAG: type II toxin-antitoxin system HigB family toxin [Sulfuricella sp.]